MPAKDITDQRFGKLVAKYPTRNSKGELVWFCECDCGGSSLVPCSSLTSGNSKSCGCGKSNIGDNTRTHGHSGSRLYGVWSAMKDRCRNPNNKRYSEYGGRGITYCAEWEDYAVFEQWAYGNGYDENAKYGECTLDRIDTNGNYNPDNCRFADSVIQANNQRRLKLYEFDGESHTLGEWARIKGINYQTLSSRIHRSKMTICEALTKSLQ